MLGGDIRTTLNRSLHFAMYQEFIETHLIGVALETRKGKLCDCERIIVVALCGSFFVLFLFVSLRGGHSMCDKGKIRSMRFWSQESTHFGLWDSWLSVLAVRYSIEPPSIPAIPAWCQGPTWRSGWRTARRQWRNGGKLLCSNYKQQNIRRHKRSLKF
jgi:hypothetical protein